MAVVTIKHLLEAGVHFGHKTRRWNPKMKKFIFESREGIYILDLQKTLEQLREACRFVRKAVLDGGSVLFVGTKKQAKDAIEKAGSTTGMHFVTERWLGGTLTNNSTIRKSIQRLRYLDGLFEDGTAEGLSKKEISAINRERARLHKNLDGIINMTNLPGVVYVVDPNREKIATAEARKLGIPIIAMVDTNCDPEIVDFAVPANDDAIKSVNLVTSIIAKIVQEALQEREKLGIVVEETPPAEEPPPKAEKPQRRPSRRPPRPRSRSSKPGPERKTGPRPKPKRAKPAISTTQSEAETAPASEAAPEQPKPDAATERPEAEAPVETTEAEMKTEVPEEAVTDEPAPDAPPEAEAAPDEGTREEKTDKQEDTPE